MIEPGAVSPLELAYQALAVAGLHGDIAGLWVMSDYTHLVLGCLAQPLPGDGGGAAGPGAPGTARSPGAVVIKFWRNERKQPLDTFAHRLAAGHVPVPAIVATGYVHSPATGSLTPRFPVLRGEPVAFTLYQTVSNARPADDLEPGWPAGTVRNAYEQAGRWLGKLHSLKTFERSGPLARFTGGWQGTAGDWYDFLAGEIERWDQELATYAVSRPHRRLRRRIRDWMLEQGESLASADRFVLCHRDYSFRNVLAHPDGTLAAVIDFEHALSGDPVFDWFRVAARLLCERGDYASWWAFLKGYADGLGRAVAAGLVLLDAIDRTAPGTGQRAAVETGLPRPAQLGLTPQAAARLMVYLSFYGITAMGYALRENDTGYYQQGLALLEWVAAALDLKGIPGPARTPNTRWRNWSE